MRIRCFRGPRLGSQGSFSVAFPLKIEGFEALALAEGRNNKKNTCAVCFVNAFLVFFIFSGRPAGRNFGANSNAAQKSPRRNFGASANAGGLLVAVYGYVYIYIYMYSLM